MNKFINDEVKPDVIFWMEMYLLMTNGMMIKLLLKDIKML